MLCFDHLDLNLFAFNVFSSLMIRLYISFFSISTLKTDSFCLVVCITSFKISKMLFKLDSSTPKMRSFLVMCLNLFVKPRFLATSAITLRVQLHVVNSCTTSSGLSVLQNEHRFVSFIFHLYKFALLFMML